MTLKRTADSKRARLPRASDYAKSFLKDWERLSRFGRYDMNRLKKAMLLLTGNDGLLGAEWRDHALGGDWECYIGGDFLLAYRIDDAGRTGSVVFVRAGTHAELFEWYRGATVWRIVPRVLLGAWQWRGWSIVCRG